MPDLRGFYQIKVGAGLGSKPPARMMQSIFRRLFGNASKGGNGRARWSMETEVLLCSENLDGTELDTKMDSGAIFSNLFN